MALGKEQLRAHRIRDSFYEFVREMWSVVEPSMSFMPSKHVSAICEHLQAVGEDRIRRLLINIPPGHAKSLLTAVMFPAWMWLRNPGWRVLCGSYALDLAIRDSQRSRDLIVSTDYQEVKRALGLKWEMAGDQNVKSHFANTEKGFRMSLSVSGKATGFRGDCVLGDTMVATEHGEIAIEDLVSMLRPPRVWSFNHERGEPELARITATRRIDHRPVIKLSTSSGRDLYCTGDHRIFASGRGYVRACDLREGDETVTNGSFPMSAMRRNGRDPVVRISETSDESQRSDAVLFESMLVDASTRNASSADVRGRLRKVARMEDGPSRASVLFGRMCSVDANTSGHHVSGVLEGVSSEHVTSGVLLGTMCERGTLGAHDGSGKLSLQTWAELPSRVRLDVGTCFREGRGQVRDLRDSANLQNREQRTCSSKSPRAPHRSQSTEQPTREFDHDVQHTSRRAPQIESDAISISGRACDGTHSVYDIQVEGNSNFFANGILVHNCLIFDDLVNAKEPDKITRESLQEATSWWNVTMSSRLNDLRRGTKIGIMQRVSEFDPCTDLITRRVAGGGFEYDLLAMPSEYDPDLYRALGRTDATTSIGWHDWRTEPGEPLFPSLFPPEVLHQAKEDLGSLAYAAQHGQRPSPAAGGSFNPKWWRFWVREGEKMPPPVTVDTKDGKIFECPQVRLPRLTAHTISADLAFKGTVNADNVAIQCWAWGDQEGLRSARFLLDQVCRKMDFVTTLRVFEEFCERHPSAGTKLVEDKANGPALISTLKDKITGIIPINPQGGKEDRANAVAPLIESGYVYLPHPHYHPWVSDFLAEARAFPNGKHDDAVDAMTQYLARKRVIVV